MIWRTMQKDYNEQSLDKRCMSTVQLLIDIENLAHADYMTGTLNSGIPYLIEVHAWPTHIPLSQAREPSPIPLLINAWKTAQPQLLLSSHTGLLTLAQGVRSTWHDTPSKGHWVYLNPVKSAGLAVHSVRQGEEHICGCQLPAQ